MKTLKALTRRVRTRVATRIYHNPVGQRLLRMTRGCRAPIEWARRARAARIFATPGEIDVDPSIGYRRLTRQELPGIDPLLERCAYRIREVRPSLPEWTAAQPDQFRIAFDLLGDEHLSRWPEFLDFALSEPILGTVTRYFGSLPVLRRVALGYSPASVEPPQGSQLFHFDGEDSRQLKLFVALSDIDATDGPLTFHGATVSKRARRSLPRSQPDSPTSRVHGPYSDETVAHILQEPAHRLEGSLGTALWLDTSRCLHFGSRVQPGRERFMLMLAFRPFPAVHETPYNIFNDSRFAHDPLRRAVLRAPSPRPPGWFFPTPEVAPGPAGRGRSRADAM